MIAIDLGLDTVDNECINRGCDIVNYEIEVKAYLRTYDAKTREAALQMAIRQHLEQHKGVLSERELKKLAKADEYGTTAWSQAFNGLVNTKAIKVTGQGTKGDPRMVRLLVSRRDGRVGRDEL